MDRLSLRVLGSAAGGGFPQWNCQCSNCDGFRSQKIKSRSRTQSSIAVSSDGHRWILINASPDIHKQINNFPDFYSDSDKRINPFSACILVDSQLDHTAGLLLLRENREPLNIYCTPKVKQDLTTGFPLFNILHHYCDTNHYAIGHPLNNNFSIPSADHLLFSTITLKGKSPPYSNRKTLEGDNIAIVIEHTVTQKKIFYAPGLMEITDEIENRMQESDCVLVDGTFWSEDEMITAGVGRKLASEMGHLPQSGENGMIALLKKLRNSRKILIHINNTNPILDEMSEQRLQLNAEQIEVAYDGMEIIL